MVMRRIILIILGIDLLFVALLIVPGIVRYIDGVPISIDDTVQSTRTQFRVDRSYVLTLSTCVTFSWNAENVASIFFDGHGVAGVDSRVVCSLGPFPRDYELLIHRPDGGEHAYHITVDYAISPHLLLTTIIVSLPLLAFIFYNIVQYDIVKRSPLTAINNPRTMQEIIVSIVTIFSVPIIITVLLLLRHSENLFDLMPYSSDGYFYLSQSASFAKAGLNSGYYTVNEESAKISLFHFYAWGPFVPMVYGSFIKFFSKALYSIPLANHILIALATSVYIGVVRPNIKQLLLLIAVFIFFPPLILYSVVSIDMLLQLALGICVAAGFWKLIVSDENPSQSVRYSLAILLIVAAFGVRPTWGILFFPYAFLAFPKRRILALIFVALVFIFAIVTQSMVSAPYPSFRGDILKTAEQSIFEAFQIVVSNMLSEFVGFFNSTNVAYVNQHRLHSGFLILLSSFGIIISFFRKRDTSSKKATLYLWGICLFTLVSIFMLVGAALDNRLMPEFRWVAPYLLMLTAILIATKRYVTVVISIVLMVSVYPSVLTKFDENTTFVTDTHMHQIYEEWQIRLTDTIQYDADTGNAWCNTVLSDVLYLNTFANRTILLALDSGIGLSWTQNWSEMQAGIQSRYLLVMSADFDNLEARFNLHRLQDLPNARLYQNLDADC